MEYISPNWFKRQGYNRKVDWRYFKEFSDRLYKQSYRKSAFVEINLINYR
jgi:hypothetical protein